MILVSSFQKTMFYLMISNNAIFSNFKVTKIEHSACFGTPGIDRIKRCNLFHQNEWIFSSSCGRNELFGFVGG